MKRVILPLTGLLALAACATANQDVPVEVRIVPTFQVVAGLGLLNSYAGLSVPLIASATATFLFRQVCLTMPDELVEADPAAGSAVAKLTRAFPGAALVEPT